MLGLIYVSRSKKAVLQPITMHEIPWDVCVMHGTCWDASYIFSILFSFLDGIPATVYVPTGIPKDAAILVYFHGGGMVIGSRASVDSTCRRLAMWVCHTIRKRLPCPLLTTTLMMEWWTSYVAMTVTCTTVYYTWEFNTCNKNEAV